MIFPPFTSFSRQLNEQKVFFFFSDFLHDYSKYDVFKTNNKNSCYTSAELNKLLLLNIHTFRITLNVVEFATINNIITAALC